MLDLLPEPSRCAKRWSSPRSSRARTAPAGRAAQMTDPAPDRSPSGSLNAARLSPAVLLQPTEPAAAGQRSQRRGRAHIIAARYRDRTLRGLISASMHAFTIGRSTRFWKPKRSSTPSACRANRILQQLLPAKPVDETDAATLALDERNKLVLQVAGLNRDLFREHVTSDGATLCTI